MLREYVPLLMLMGFVVLNGAAFVILSQILSHRRPTLVKGIPYESGMPPLGSARERFSVKFYLVAMMFIVFDLEAVFMIPWAQAFRRLGLFGSWRCKAHPHSRSGMYRGMRALERE
jgi:NADH-quinone oxidoreductase subunit A